MTGSRSICILSPPRSGSSLTARITSILGVHLGASAAFEEPSVHNPKGYWEHQTIQNLNNEILSRLGYDYFRVGANWAASPEFPDNWEMDPELSDLKARAEEFIANNFSKYDVWGWKDPRTCFTLPFWQSLLPRIQYVILIRNPMDVARSIERFLGCSFERGLYIWLLHLNSIFRYTEGQSTLLVNVEAWTDAWKDEFDRLASFLGYSGLADDKDIETEVHELVDKSLWHHRTSLDALRIVQDLYEQLSTSRSAPAPEACAEIQDSINFLASEGLHGDAEKTQRDELQWKKQFALASGELANVVPHGRKVILVDDNQIGPDVIEGRNVIPFLERNGQYWGCPSDGATAVRELERLRNDGAEYMAFVWPAHWWLDYFPELDYHLRSRFRCIMQNERLIVFDLRP